MPPPLSLPSPSSPSMFMTLSLTMLLMVVLLLGVPTPSHAGEGASNQQQNACGAYRGATCDEILMTQVLGEQGAAFAVKMVVAAALGMFIGIQREFGVGLGSLLPPARNTPRSLQMNPHAPSSTLPNRRYSRRRTPRQVADDSTSPRLAPCAWVTSSVCSSLAVRLPRALSGELV